MPYNRTDRKQQLPPASREQRSHLFQSEVEVLCELLCAQLQL